MLETRVHTRHCLGRGDFRARSRSSSSSKQQQARHGDCRRLQRAGPEAHSLQRRGEHDHITRNCMSRCRFMSPAWPRRQPAQRRASHRRCRPRIAAAARCRRNRFARGCIYTSCLTTRHNTTHTTKNKPGQGGLPQARLAAPPRQGAGSGARRRRGALQRGQGRLRGDPAPPRRLQRAAAGVAAGRQDGRGVLARAQRGRPRAVGQVCRLRDGVAVLQVRVRARMLCSRSHDRGGRLRG